MHTAELWTQAFAPDACISQPERDWTFVRVQNATQSSFDEGAQRRLLLGRVSPCSLDKVVGQFYGGLHYRLPYFTERLPILV